MRKLLRKRILVPVVALAALALAGIAFAYFTSSGTGSGRATVGTDANVAISIDSFDSTLYPGGSTVVRFTITNNSANTPVQVGKVVADTSYGTTGVDGLPDGCNAADFTFADVPVNTEILAGASVRGTGTLSMADPSNENQDLCKNTTPTLHLKVDNTGL